MKRVFNFSAGPATLPEEVLIQAEEELLDWHGSKMSVMEMSHRSKEFLSIAEESERDLRELLSVPSNYKILFIQGGATLQFSMVPLNLMTKNGGADYIITGTWGKKAAQEAQAYGQVKIIADTHTEKGFLSEPDAESLVFSKSADYIHYTPNETIEGVEFSYVPDTGDLPLVADMSSTILSRPINISQFGIIYAGAQKNIGPAGLTIVIIREDLINKSLTKVPTMLRYETHSNNQSMYNTPPTYSWYLAGLVFKWLIKKGGLQSISEANKSKADLLYSVIDSSKFYNNPVEKICRSKMNITFTLANKDLQDKFISHAHDEGLVALKGHRSVGGMRASIYNAMPLEGVRALTDFMSEFERKNG